MSLPCWTDSWHSERALTQCGYFPSLASSGEPGLLFHQSCSPCILRQSESPEPATRREEDASSAESPESGQEGVTRADEEGEGCKPALPVCRSESR